MNGRELVTAAHVTSPIGSGVVTRRLCVVSRNPLMSGVFVAGLTTAVGSRDELEIIVDRRRDGATTNRPSIERRQRDHVARALERDGFAFVLLPAAETSANSSSKRGAWPTEPVVPEETYEHKLERILWFKQGRIIRLSRWLILSVLMNAILVLFFVSSTVKTRMSQARPPGSASSIVTPLEKVAEPPSPRPAPPGVEATSPRPDAAPRPRP
jgi:hypothetical protein